MKFIKSFLLIFISIFSQQVVAQDFSSTKKVAEELRNLMEVEEFVNAGKTEYKLINKEIGQKHPLYNLLTENQAFFEYVYNKYPIGSDNCSLTLSEIEKIKANPLLSLNKIYFDSLVTDKYAGYVLMQTVCLHLTGKGYRISDFKPMKKVKTNEKELLGYSSRLFVLSKDVTETLDYKMINLLDGNNTVEKTMVEALCFEAMVLNFEKDNHLIKSEFLKIFDKIKDLKLDNEEEKLNIQKQVQTQFEQTQALKKTLFQTVTSSNLKTMFAF